MNRNPIPRLHVITDEVLQTSHTHSELAKLAVAGGADAIQFREKRNWTTHELLASARDIQAICQRFGSLLVINDRVDVAFALGNEAIHLGQDDLPTDTARKLIGSGSLIGATANSLEQAIAVDKLMVDYVGVGPVFGTKSKAKRAPDLGLEKLNEICESIDLPVIAIGNIRPQNVGEIIDAGAWGIAVLSGIVCQPDIRSATERYVQALGSAGVQLTH